ncbi:hypothetical protein HGA92_04755 [Candidatus Gracilibacteria bacterium]|nr:hypothetical protein [Candidatus Gracilibacteria bacterium]NUJ98455.1 hypothetical protein [Candidatus Gracilibacteria bacterium]
MEKIVETRICKHCGASFDITDKDLEFYEKVSPVFPNPGVSFSTPGLKLLENGKIKYLIPPPTLCPDCRQQRRLSFRNERKLYKRKCDFSGKDIISIYSPDKPYKVYHQGAWWSDGWDALNYGRNFDFSKSFFEQFGYLMKEVPQISIMNDNGTGSENCEYCQDFCFGKNCYFSIATWHSENQYYCDQCLYGKDLVDCTLVNNNSSDVYEGTICDSIKNCFYVYSCIDCFECHACFDLIGCQFCYGSNSLRNKKYYFLNKALSKKEYEDEMKRIKKSDTSKLFSNIKKGKILPATIIKNSQNCIGDNIINSKNVFYGFDVSDVQDSKFVFRLNSNARDCYDIHQSGATTLVYEGLTPDKTHHGSFISWCWEGCKDIYYCDNCHTCSNCFGCIGLRNKSYCILNKQYTKSEYEILVPKIIEHMMTPPKSPSIEGESGAIVKQGEQEWGEFFPSSLSPFGYNETVANEYYPINTPPIPHPFPKKEKGNNSCLFSFSLGGKDAGKADRGTFNWSTYEAPFPKVEKIIPASKLPENIADIPDDILNWAIECEVTKKPFRIIKEELAFYRKHNLPIPRRHPDQRHLDRMSLRNPRHLYTRNCDKCGKEIQTTYAPERPEIVYCEECYNSEIY